MIIYDNNSLSHVMEFGIYGLVLWFQVMTTDGTKKNGISPLLSTVERAMYTLLGLTSWHFLLIYSV
jgi:hypothetical protein